MGPETYAAIAAFSTTVGVIQQQKAGRAQRQSQRLQQKMAENQNRRERIQALRQARIARSQAAAAQSATSGGGVSSQALGIQGSIQSQAGANIAFSNQQQGLMNQISTANIDASRAMTNASTFQGITSLASTGFEMSGGYDKLMENNPELAKLFR
jgi:hypothetical protein